MWGLDAPERTRSTPRAWRELRASDVHLLRLQIREPAQRRRHRQSVQLNLESPGRHTSGPFLGWPVGRQIRSAVPCVRIGNARKFTKFVGSPWGCWAMSASRRLVSFISLVCVFAALSLPAMAEQVTKKPTPKAQAVQPKGSAVGGRPAIGAGHPATGPGHAAAGRPGGRGPAAGRGPHFAHDRSHWGDRERRSWAGGHWRPYECRFGRCGYWWAADGYWYFYDHPMDGPPDVVSDVEYADPATEAAAPPPPDAVAVPAPIVIQRPPVCVGPVCL